MRLIYFDIPGKAEAIRLCAAVAGVQPPVDDHAAYGVVSWPCSVHAHVPLNESSNAAPDASP